MAWYHDDGDALMQDEEGQLLFDPRDEDKPIFYRHDSDDDIWTATFKVLYDHQQQIDYLKDITLWQDELIRDLRWAVEDLQKNKPAAQNMFAPVPPPLPPVPPPPPPPGPPPPNAVKATIEEARKPVAKKSSAMDKPAVSYMEEMAKKIAERRAKADKGEASIDLSKVRGGSRKPSKKARSKSRSGKPKRKY